MNITIWKYPIRVTDEQYLIIPRGATPVHLAEQDGTLCIWALVDPTKVPHEYTVRVYGTGHPIDEKLEQVHIGSVLKGPFVWHVFWQETTS